MHKSWPIPFEPVGTPTEYVYRMVEVWFHLPVCWVPKANVRIENTEC